MMDVSFLLYEWLIVFLINVIPAFAPPTWITLSVLNLAYPPNIFVLVAVGVTASTTGRFVLSKFAGFFTERFGGKKLKEEMLFLRKKLSGKPVKKFLFTVIFSLSPLPSNVLFIAVGAAKIRLREVLAGFFVGRTISYLFLVFTVGKVFSSIGATIEGTATIWTIAIEVIGAIAILAFFLIDWKKILSGFPGKKKKRKR